VAVGINPTRAERIGVVIAVLLSASAGAVDIIAYLKFDHVFVANMTGNTVLFASDMVAAQFSQAVNHLLPIVTFLLGVVTARGEAIASLLQRPVDRDERLKIWVVGSIWTAYALGATGGALAALHIGRQSLLFPASLLCLSAIFILVTHSRRS
jgi:uncharacterized membrane protein YoaK (UPF0700 family)